jgi:hypothetical protein
MVAGRWRRLIPGGLPVVRVRGGALERCFAVGNPICGGNGTEAHRMGSFHGGARPDEMAMRVSLGRWQRTGSRSKAADRRRGSPAAKGANGAEFGSGIPHGGWLGDSAAVHEEAVEASGRVLISTPHLEQRSGKERGGSNLCFSTKACSG